MSEIGAGGPLEREPARLTERFYATRPTAWVLFLRTFLPWQLWRFVVINLKMLRIIARSHGRGDRTGGQAPPRGPTGAV
ncbi:MAG: hypothetical protein L0027_14530 [Candidatus Rokubacteria bacterium]|nr:hypothetical protein [Candidatus Rokubacteria bacterium]